MKKIKIFIKSILIPIIVGGVVSLFISKSINYNDLIKPKLAPPSVLFPIVWTILYILMGISYGILESKGLTDKRAKILYYSQLFVNALWSIIFFIFKCRLFAFIWIILLDILVVYMIINFYSKNKLAGLLQIPYLVWILFATYLNFSIYLLNR